MVRLKGYPHVSQTFDKFADAEAWGREMERKQKLGDTPVELRKQLQGVTLDTLIAEYRQDRAINVHKRKRSHANEDVMLDAFSKREPALCRKPIATLTRRDLQDYCDRRLRGPLAVKPSTLRRELNPLRHILNRYARRDKGLPVPNPFRDLDLPQEGAHRERFLSVDEMQKIYASVYRCRGRRLPLLWLSLIMTAYLTGLRRGELLSIVWGDIDFQKRTLLVRPEISKTKKGRLLPLCRGINSHLYTYRHYVPESERQPDKRVFPISGSAHEQAFRRILNRAGVSNVKFHDLRHTAATLFDSLELTRSENEYMLGHSGSSVNSRYVHADIERIRAKLDVGYEEIELPKSEEELELSWEFVHAPEEEWADFLLRKVNADPSILDRMPDLKPHFKAL